MYRNSYIEVDLDALEANARFFMERNHKKVIGVVKANGYGIGAFEEVKTLKGAGVDFFAVSSLDEALHLRKNGISDQILVLGYVPLVSMDTVRENDISIVTLSKEFIEKADLNDVKVHLKIDTGMNRIGVETDEAKQVLDLLVEKGAVIEGVMSHFSSADSDKEYSQKQYDLFKETVLSLKYDFPYIHMSATDAALLIDDDICNAQRIGLGLLGYSCHENRLKPVMKLCSEVSMVKQLKAGETVSYGRHYTSNGEGWLLTIPLGYADGFYRSNSGKKAYCDYEYGTIVGSICMDQMMILTDSYHPVGTRIELLGGHIDIDQRAIELSTIPYELFTSLSDRLTRYYFKDQQIISKIDPRF